MFAPQSLIRLMETIISKIKTLANAQNASDKQISLFIIEQGFDLSALSATKMGRLLGRSDSTIIRYAKALGCSGFPDFKLQLAAARPRENADQHEIYEGINAGDSTRQVVEKSKRLFASKIEQSLDLIDPRTIDDCAQQLINARKIVLTGIGSSALVALDINHKLIRSGLNALFNHDYHTQLVQASLLQPDDVLLAISARGETDEIVEALKLAQDAGAKTIAITRYGRNRVSQLANFVIPHSYSEVHEKLGMVTSQILQMIAFDVLFFKINSLISPDHMSRALSTIGKLRKPGNT